MLCDLYNNYHYYTTTTTRYKKIVFLEDEQQQPKKICSHSLSLLSFCILLSVTIFQNCCNTEWKHNDNNNDNDNEKKNIIAPRSI